MGSFHPCHWAELSKIIERQTPNIEKTDKSVDVKVPQIPGQCSNSVSQDTPRKRKREHEHDSEVPGVKVFRHEIDPIRTAIKTEEALLTLREPKSELPDIKGFRDSVDPVVTVVKSEIKNEHVILQEPKPETLDTKLYGHQLEPLVLKTELLETFHTQGDEDLDLKIFDAQDLDSDYSDSESDSNSDSESSKAGIFLANGLTPLQKRQGRMKERCRKNMLSYPERLTQEMAEYKSYRCYSNNRFHRNLPVIIIHGTDVAFSYSRGENFACRGIERMVRALQDSNPDQEVLVFAPRFRCRRNESVGFHILHKLEREGVLKYTASRDPCNGEELIVSEDDQYVLEFGTISGGIIISNDTFERLDGLCAKFNYVIRNRILGYTWSHGKPVFKYRPLGPEGPIVDEFLKSTSAISSVKET